MHGELLKEWIREQQTTNLPQHVMQGLRRANSRRAPCSLLCRYEGLCALRRKYSELFWPLPGLFSLTHPFLQQQLSVQAVSNFLLQRNKKLLYFMSELLDLLLAGMDQPQADQPSRLAEGLSSLNQL